MQANMMFPITFSGIRPDEKAAVIRLITEAGLGAEDLDADKLVHFIVARCGDIIAGVVGLEPAGENVLLRSLAVAANFRHQAVATRLVAAIEKYAKSNGTRAIYLITTDAAAFFSKQGYLSTEREAAPEAIQDTEAFRVICPATAQCLVKQLMP